MAGSPERPTQVPAAAVWSEMNGEWELAPGAGGDGGSDGGGDSDSNGNSDGNGHEVCARSWRADGTLRTETPYRDGAPHGLALRFHPDGSVARQTRYVQGRPDGTVVARASDAETGEPLQPCCVPPGAWEMHLDYELGNFIGQRWYDRAGVHILPSGKPFPPRPAAVSADARFEEETDRWLSGTYTDKGELHGVWLRWSREGVLLERDTYDTAKAHGLWQRFLPSGALQEEASFQHGLRTGPYRQAHFPAGRYADSRINEERGTFEQDQAVGVWTLHDDAGQVLRRHNLGVAVTRESLAQSPALAPAPPSSTAASATGAAAWMSLAASLEADGRIGESVLAAARGAAAAGSADDLRLLLAGLAMPMTMASAEELALQLIRTADGQLPLLVNGFGRGGDAARLLRAIAAGREGADQVSLDLVDAAILLDPTLHEGRVTRALLQLHRGHPLAARLDAESLPAEWTEQRDFLLGYARALFPVFDFWPARRPVETLMTDIPGQPDQDLGAVRAQIQKYATRLQAIRAAVADLLRADGDHPRPWLIPDLTALLPDGPVPLEAWEFEEIVVDEDGEAIPTAQATAGGDGGADEGNGAAEPTPTRVTVDERLSLEGQTLSSLQRLARREWNALCWLCWSAGLDRVALPATLAPPANFGQAAGMTVQRLWRCRDKLATGGLRAMTQGVPGFEWEGIAIDGMAPVLAEIALLEYLELRALFFWLCDAGVQSPWQDNLRSET